MSLPSFANCVHSPCILICAVNIRSSSCDSLAVHHIGLPGTVRNVQLCMVKFHTQILHSTLCFFAAALPDACTAIVHTEAYHRHSAGLRMNKVTLHHLPRYLTLIAECLLKCMQDSSPGVSMLRFWQ